MSLTKAIRLNKIIELKERYRTLSEICEFFPRKGSNHKAYVYANKEMVATINELETLEVISN